MRQAWTEEDSRYLIEHYVTDGAKACAIALGRTWRSVTKRAKTMGITRIRRWRHREDDQLRILWGHHPIKHIAKTLGRTPAGIYERARLLKLGLGCPQGWERLSRAAERTGYAVSQLRRILNWAHVPITRASVKPGGKTTTRRVRWVVEPSEVDEAVTRWLATENVEAAAGERGLCSSILYRLLREAIAQGDERVPSRPKRRRHWRIPTTLIDELVGAYTTRESLTAAGLRVQVSPHTLGLWLKEAGVSYSRMHGVPSGEVDRVVEAKRAAGCHAWRTRRAA